MSRKIIRVWLVVLFACGVAGAATAQDTSKRIVDLRIEGGAVSGDIEAAGGLGVVRVTQGDAVELRWTTDETTEVHLQGYNVEAELSAEGETLMSFRAKFGGRFALEAHTHGGGGGKTILYIEVRPK